MNIQIQAQSQFFSVPVSDQGESMNLIIRHKQEFMQLSIIPADPDRALFTAHYRLPFPAEGTVLDADPRLLEYLIWQNHQPEKKPDPAHSHPRFHFSPNQGWINDPNGMYWQDGLWHLFFQHNPLSSGWGNMHWGHAVSKDLLHWEEKEIALYPDSTGTMYSGSAVIDHKNSADFGKDAVLLFYTARSDTTPHTGSQCMAVVQNGEYVKYKMNPLIPCMEGFVERDPNIVFDPDSNIWRMALYSGNEEKKDFILLSSNDLLHWTETDRYLLPGDRECPGLRRMKDRITGQELWVFTAANGFYRVGTISAAGKVSFLTETKRFLYGDAYAGQFFYNAPSEKHIFMAWIRMSSGQFRSWSGCMTLPLEITLANGELEVTPAVDVPKTPVCWKEKITLHGPAGELIIDPQENTVRNGDKCFNINAAEQDWTGFLIQDEALVEYADARKRFFAAFYFSGVTLR